MGGGWKPGLGVGVALVVAVAVAIPSVAAAAAGSPYITVQPSNVTAAPKQSAALYAVAKGSPTPTVQWQVHKPGSSGFVNIPNATNLSYHFAALSSLTGYQYRAVFTNANGVAVTRTATLTVRPGLPGPFVEVIFSRSEVTAADNCVENNTNVARLDTTVAPFIASLGLTATGSIETSPTQQSAEFCAHYNNSLSASWDQVSALGAQGWTFVDHSADYPDSPQEWAALTPRQMWLETCGSAQVIDAHGLKGASDMYLWPTSTGQPSKVNKTALADFVAPCFGVNREYTGGTTLTTGIAKWPYRESIRGANGGSCDTRNLPCSTAGPEIYWTPGHIISAIRNLRPGEVMALQAYVLVTGKNPSYTSSTERWDCTSGNSSLHWTNDVERYCWTDFQKILEYLVTSGVGISPPRVVNTAAGRTGYSDHRVAEPASTVRSTAGEPTPAVPWKSVFSGPDDPIAE